MAVVETHEEFSLYEEKKLESEKKAENPNQLSLQI
jgi:hypothetical protein